MTGQTTIEPCAICGEPSERQIVLVPAEYEIRGGVRKLVKLSVDRWMCTEHATRAETQADWKADQAAARKTQRAEMRRNQGNLFDAEPRRGHAA